ncbi:hypothetical protein BKM32_10610 [Mangrovimonas sp. DI 80]|nr:hypothetical protein BKM32_10610 [Mangrovimonas sp. DI 80]
MSYPFSKSFEAHTLKNWAGRSKINNVERYLLSKYFDNNQASVLDAGTGAGILPFHLEQERGFKNITAFDIIPQMIEIAKSKAIEKQSNINFLISDASDLKGIESNQFGYLCYTQQILSMVPKNRLKPALQEAHRVGKKDCTLIASFLDWNARWYNPILNFNTNAARFIQGKPLQNKYLPEVNFNGRLNWKFYSKEQHPLLWAKKSEIINLLHDCGFKIKSFYTEEDLTNKKGYTFYFVCTKANVE